MSSNAMSGIFRHVTMYVAASKFLGMFRGCLQLLVLTWPP